MKNLLALTQQHPIAAFFILAFTSSWGLVPLADGIYESTQSVPLALPLALLATGPLVSALLVSAMIGGKAGILALLRKFTVWRVGWHWYVVALLLQPALNLTAIYLNVSLGAPAPPVAAFGPWSALLGAFVLRLVNPWDGPMMEELGWRGFAQPRWQQRYAPLTAVLILAVLVAFWHLRLIPSGDYSWTAIPGTIAVTILYGWVYNATGGSVLLPLLMHAVEPLVNANFTGVYQTRYVVVRVSVYAVTAVIVVLLTGKNLGRKETPVPQTDVQPAATPV